MKGKQNKTHSLAISENTCLRRDTRFSPNIYIHMWEEWKKLLIFDGRFLQMFLEWKMPYTHITIHGNYKVHTILFFIAQLVF